MANIMLQRFKNVLRYSRQLWTVSESQSNICLKQDENTDLIKFPYVWLRDNCQCSKCFHEASQSRTIFVKEFDFDAEPKKTEITDDDKLLKIIWNDDHKSTFPLSWLMERQFKSDAQNHWKNTIYRDKKTPWTAKEFTSIMKKSFSYKNILESNDELLSWLEVLAIYGVALIKDAGNNKGTIKELAERVFFLKRTQYGVTFDVTAKLDTTNVAYLSGPLQLHTDLPYCHYKPGVNLIHCIVQGSEGGENHFVDCVAVANWLKENNNEVYTILRDTNIIWTDKCTEDGKSFHCIHIAPVICENSLGDIERINLSQPQRDSQFFGSTEEAKAWYKALKIFSEMAYSSKYSSFHKMEIGDIVTFDNTRMLHGRLKYEGHRFVEGGYLDWDMIYSKIRVLRSRKN